MIVVVDKGWIARGDAVSVIPDLVGGTYAFIVYAVEHHPSLATNAT